MNSSGFIAREKAVPPSGLESLGGVPRQLYRLGPVGLFAASLSLAAPVANAQTGTYIDIGSASGLPISSANGISDDGTAAAVMATDGSTAWRVYRWSSTGGLTALADFGFGGAAAGISADGTVVVGSVYLNAADHAALWTSSGMTDLGTFGGVAANSSRATAVSADGTTVVGSSFTPNASSEHAFRWTSAGGMADLGVLAGGSWSEAYAVSGNGSVVAGGSYGGNGYWAHAFIWTQAVGMVDLGTLGGVAANSSVAWGVSRDGTVVVGSSDPANAAVGYSGGDQPITHAFRWTQTGGMVDLGVLSGTNSSVAIATNSDGSVVVGVSASASTDYAFRWTQATGMQNLNVLLASAGVNMTGITLQTAQAISANGQFIAGGSNQFMYTYERLYPTATTTGDAWIVRYCDTTCTGGAPAFGGVLTAAGQASVQTSVNQVAQARTTVLAQQNALAAPLLGDGQRIGSPSDRVSGKIGEVGSFVSVGSLEGGAFARYDTKYGVSILGGLSYQQASFQGAQVQPSLLGALALRYVYGGFGSIRPIAEVGGWVVPEAPLSFSRSYENGAGTATAKASTSGDLAYYYGRAGAAMEIGTRAEFALTGEIGREQMDTGKFAEAASSANPFNAAGNSASDADLAGRVRAQVSYAFTQSIDASVWGAGAMTFDSTSNFTANVAGVGTLLPSHASQAPWAEFGARIGYALTDSANIDIMANGASGPTVGTEVHACAALRYSF